METKKEINNSKLSVEEIIEMQLLKVIKKYDTLDGLCFSISKELGESLINFFITFSIYVYLRLFLSPSFTSSNNFIKVKNIIKH